MVMRIVIVLIAFAGFTFSQPPPPPEWSHQDESSWPGKCHVGMEQSPINIVTKDTHQDLHNVHIRGPLIYRGYDSVTVTARNTGYKVRWAARPGYPAPVLTGGPLRTNYTFAEIHFHWLSEHAINGIKYPLEMHLVHLKEDLTFGQALEQPDGVAVIGIMAQVGTPYSSHVLDEFIPAVPYVLAKSNYESSVFTIDLTKLFSPNPQAFYTYHGSLTTPLCPEVVTWIVMHEPTLVSHQNYKNLTRADLTGINNDRAVQPVGDRMVYRTRYVPSSSSIIAPSTFGSAAAIFSILGSKLSSAVLGGFSGLMGLKKRLLGRKECEGKCESQ